MKFPESLKLYPFAKYSWKIKYLDLCPLWKCDARCPTCGAWKRKEQNQLSREQAVIIATHLIDLKRVVIEGGEPTIWPHLTMFVNMLTLKTKITIISNGIDTERIDDISDFIPLRVAWLISLNGIGVIHDQSRGVRGAFTKTVATIRMLKEKGFQVSTSYTPFEQNWEQYELVQAWCAEEGLGMNVCYPVKATKFGENLKWDRPSADKIVKITDAHIGKMRFLNKWYYKRFIENVQAKKVMPCFAGRSMIHINPQGIIRPCCFDESMKIGEVSDTEIKLGKTYRQWYHAQGVIPDKCQYQTGDICNDCFVFYSFRRTFL